MSSSKDVGFAERLSAAAKARKAALEKFRTQPGADDPAVAERSAARKAVSEARDARAAERKAAKAAALQAERTARDAQIAERAQREAALEAERKAARDARYAARKARQR